MNRKFVVFMISFVLIFSFTGCQKKENEIVENIVYKYGDSDISYGEFYIYAKTVEEDYEKTYGNGIWSLELTLDEKSSSVREVTLQDIVSDINRVKVLNSRAEDYEVSLNNSEKAEIENQAEVFYKGLTKKDIKETEVTKELIQKVISENIIAGKVYEAMIADHDFEVSDENARITTFYDMVFECYDAKQDGTVEEYSEEKKQEQLDKANEVLSDLAEGTEEEVSYEAIAEKNNLEFAEEKTMSKTELVEEYGDKVAEKILELEDGEISVVIESMYGYHIFRMIDANDEEQTKSNKAFMVEQQKKAYFSEIYSEWAEKYDSRFNYDTDVDKELLKAFPYAKE